MMGAFGVLLLGALLFVCGTCACEVVLTDAEISADRSRGIKFSSVGGYTVSGAGDVNGDGFDDFAVANPNSNVHGEYVNAGEIFLVFGRSAAAWESASFDFGLADTPDPSSWIKISGDADEMVLGENGIAHGDFNGDGLSDVLISTELSEAFCVFGHSGAWKSFNTSMLGIQAIGGVPGFVINGGTSLKNRYVGNAGDMNGDGIEDIIVSDGDVGRAYIVFGEPGTNRNAFDVTTIDGTNGFSVSDGAPSTGNCITMGSAGDVNGDGLADLVLGAYSALSAAGRAYVLFARDVSVVGQWSASISLNIDLDGTNGFAVTGPASSQLGWLAVGAGDVNADGFADIFLGSSSGKGAWFVFGHAAPWVSPLDASMLDGTNGFHFVSTGGEDWGRSGSGVGDFNGDGVDDILISSYEALNTIGTDTGEAAIIFGHSGAWPAEFNRTDVAGSVGFLIDGKTVDSYFGWSASGAGDVNGDGHADFLVGVLNAAEAVLVFGVADDHCAVCSNTTDECLVCDDGFILNGTICEVEPSAPFVSSSSSSSSTAASFASVASSSFPSSSSAFSCPSSAHQQGVSVVVIINFLDNVTDPTGLEEEIASVLGIDAGLVSVVVISPTEVEVTIIGSEELALHLVEIINNGGTGSDGSGLGLLRKAIDAHIRKDNNDNGSSDDDGVDDAPRVALLQSTLLAIVAFSVMAL